MDIEALLRKAEQDGCMVVLNDIAPNRERNELVFRVPESVYDTPVAALDIDEGTKSALQSKKSRFWSICCTALRWGKMRKNRCISRRMPPSRS